MENTVVVSHLVIEAMFRFLQNIGYIREDISLDDWIHSSHKLEV